MPRPRRAVLAAVLAAAVVAAGVGVVGVAEAGGGTAASGRAPVAHPVPSRPSLPRADRAARDTAVTPLTGLTAPDVTVELRRPATPSQLDRLRRTAGVGAIAVLDRGRIHVRGRTLRAVGVDASEVRAFTPSLTARSDALWQSVARGELTVSYARSQRLHRQLGRDLVARGRRHHHALVRLGALASIGLGSAQAVVDHADAHLLGLHPARRLLISAPDLPLGTITDRVHHVLGARADVRGARPETVDQSALSDYARATIPSSYLALYRAAAGTCVGLPWTVLAAIGAVETGHGADTRVSSKGAVGPMQFLPSTFASYGIDGDGDGVADIHNPADAVYSAARYLCLSGGGRGGQALYDAIWAYNHADWYVREVIAYANAYV